MRAVCRVWWGADPQTLLIIFHALVKSHLDFASYCLYNASGRASKKLDTIQYEGLRICLGCMRSAPTGLLLSEAADMPLSVRRKMLATNIISKIITINKHPLYVLLKSLRAEHTLGLSRSRNRAIPILAEMLVKFLPYLKKIFRDKTLPCFYVDFENRMLPLKVLNLSLMKQDKDIEQFFHLQTQELKLSQSSFLRTHQRKKIQSVSECQFRSWNSGSPPDCIGRCP